MKKSIWKRIAAGVLVFCIVFNLLPVDFPGKFLKADVVSAKGFDIDFSGISEVPIENDSIQATINLIAASSNQTEKGKGIIKLDKDYTENLIVPDEATVIIDLNGHTISPKTAEENENHIAVYGILKLTDTADEPGKLVSDGTTDTRGLTVINGGKLVLEKITIDNYYSTGNGAGVRVEDGGYLNLIDGSITNCKTELQGGGVFAYNAKNVDFSSGTISGNTAQNGGGISFYLTNGINEETHFELSRMNVNGNTATENGGGLYVYKEIYLDIVDSSFDNNTSANGGGIYFANTAYLTVDADSSISSNTAGLGGGLYFYASSILKASSFTLNGGKINGNTSAGNGGGVYFYNAYSDGRPSVFINSGEVNNNISGGNGGGIYMYYHSDLTMNGGSINGNKAVQYGGGLCMDNTYQSTITSNFTMNGGTINENELTAAQTLNRLGGGVYMGYRCNANLNGGEINNNKNASHGGGFACNQNTQVYVDDGMKISGNITLPLYNGYAYGGGIYTLEYCKVIMSGGEISENGGDDYLVGGGMNISRWGSAEISGGKIINNKSCSHGGIATESVLSLSGSTEISGNISDAGAGGGVYIGWYGSVYTVTVSESVVIKNNYAAGNGGGIYSERPIEISGEVLVENNTANNGGGIYCNADTFNDFGVTLDISEDAVIRGNKAAGYGGGVSGPSPEGNSGGNRDFIMKMKGGQIVNNEAGLSGGGVSLRVNNTQYFTGGLISGNTAGANGGGVWVAVNAFTSSGVLNHRPTTVEVSTDMTISENIAKENGGGIYIGGGNRLELYNGGKIIGNLAGTYGGGVYVASNGLYHNSKYQYTNARTGEGSEESFEIYGGELRDNTASYLGNDFYAHAPASDASYATSYIKAVKASEMENAPADACWLDETNESSVTEALDNRDRVDNNESPIYSAYTFDTVSEAVAKIGDTTYKSVQEAVNAIEDGNTSGSDIIMLKSSFEDVVIPQGMKASIDLCGYSLKGVNGSIITVNADAELTITDSVGGGKLTGGKGTISGNSRLGGAIYVIEDGKCVVENVTISNNTATHGSAVYTNGGSVELRNATIENNKHSITYNYNSQANVIRIYSGALTVSDTTIKNNQGMIWLAGSTAEFSNSKISEAYGTWGIGIYADISEVTIESCQILNNVSNQSWGSVTVTNVSGVLIKDTIIKGNKTGNGAGVRATGNSTTQLENCEITQNTATNGSTGGVVAAAATLKMKDTKVYNNFYSTAYGGDISLAANVYFKNVSEDHDSRAVENWSLDGYDCWFEVNTRDYYVDNKDNYDADVFYNISSLFLNEDATEGRVNKEYLLKAVKSHLSAEYVAEIVATGVQYKSVTLAVKAALEYEGEVEIKLLKDVTESITIPYSSNHTELKLDLNGHTITASSFAQNVIYVSAGGNLTLTDSVGGGKITPPDKEEYDISKIRGVYIQGGIFTLESGEISGFDYTGNGAGIYMISGGTYNNVKYDSELYIKGGVIQNNTASGNGGGIYIASYANGNSYWNSIFDMTEGEISDNQAQNGAGLYFAASNHTNDASTLDYHARYSISGGSIKNNSASVSGGGIYYIGWNLLNAKDEVKIYGCEITDNTAVYRGGGIYAENAANGTYGFVVGDESKQTVISGNHASEYSAVRILGQYNVGYAATKGIVMTNVDVFDNESKSGTIVLTTYRLNVKNANIHNNYSSNYSGLYMNASEFLVEDCEIYENTAFGYVNGNNGKGAGIFIANPVAEGEKNVKNCEIHDNTAWYGSGIHDQCFYDVVYDNCKIYDNTSVYYGGGADFSEHTSLNPFKYFNNCSIYDNKAGTYGGGIASVGNGKNIVLNNTVIKDNVSVAQGGGIYLAGNSLTINDGTEITGNSASYGGGMYLENVTYEMNAGMISNNITTSGGGGGIYWHTAGNRTFHMNGGEISNNTSVTYGGGIYFSSYNTNTDNNTLTIEFSGGKILNNTSANGGGLGFSPYARSGFMKSIVLKNVEIAGNHASNNGGGIWINEFPTSPDGVTVEAKEGTVIRNNSAGNVGGGVYVYYCKTAFALDSGGKLYGNTAFLGNDAYVTYNSNFRSSDLYLIKASEMFGGEDAYEADAWIEEVSEAKYTDIIKIRPLDRSYAYTLSYKSKTGKTIAVYNGQEYSSVQEAVDALGNASDKTGEIIMVDDSVESVTIGSDLDITLNLNGHTLKSSGISTITNRGNLKITDEKKTVVTGTNTYDTVETTGTITGTAAQAGGGVYVVSGKVTLLGGKISDCKAGGANTSSATYGGAGVAVKSGEFVLDGGTISDNTAMRGAAVLLQSISARFTMLSGQIKDNRTSESAAGTSTGHGAIYNNSGKVFIYGGTISGNQAKYGGAISNNGSGTTSIVGSDSVSKPQIINNTAGTQGGAVYVGSGTVITENAIISRNKTTDAKQTAVNTTAGLCTSAGGAIYINEGKLNIGDDTIMERNNAVRGGAIYQYRGTVQITGSNTRITNNTAQLGGGCAQCPIPGNTTTTMTLTDGASVYGNKSTFTTAGNDFYSAWEGSNTYEQQLGANAQNTPRLSLIPASFMSVGNRYNVWKNDSYKGTERTGTSIVSGQYITAEVVLGNNVQITAAYYNIKDTQVTSVIDSCFYVKDMRVTLTDGTANFDAGQQIGNNSQQKYDDAGPYEKKAADLLEDPLSGAVTLSDTYEYNGKEYQYIEYDGRRYEQNQTVEWWPGDDSANNNNIVRSYDSLVYNFSYLCEGVDKDNMEKRDYECRLRVRAVLPCSADDAEFASLSGLNNAIVTPGVDEYDSPVQILTGYWNESVEKATCPSSAHDKSLIINVKGMKNGSTIRPTFEFWYEGNNESPHGRAISETVTVSAAPKYNITILNNEKLAYTGYFDTKHGIEVTASSKDEEGVVYGTILGYGVTAELYNDPSTKGLKGLEIPADGLEFDISFKGDLYENGTDKVEGGTKAPVVWAYKESTSSRSGRAVGSNSDTFNMNWDDEDSTSKLSYYSYGAAPYNNGSNDTSCYDGGGWVISTSSDPIQPNETKVHVKLNGYMFNNDLNPTKYAGGVSSNILNSNAVKGFSAGYIQVILPLENIDSEHLNDGFYNINMDSVVSGLVAVGISGQDPDLVKSESSLYTQEMKDADIAAMNRYYNKDNADELRTEGLAVRERRYADNFVNVSTGLYVTSGSGNSNMINKTNLFGNQNNTPINGNSTATDTGKGETPLNSTVFVNGTVLFNSKAIDISDKESIYYSGNDPLYDSQMYSVIEYDYMTAANILQKFDAEAYTPVGTKAVVGVANNSLNAYLNGEFRISTSESAAEWSSTATTSYNLTILYAAKPDGSNWVKTDSADGTYDDGGVADMDSYREENLLYFTTLDDLHRYFGSDDAKCVAILYQFRNCCIRNGRSITAAAKMNVVGDFEKVGKTYCTTNDVRAWTTYRPHFKIYYAAGTRSQYTYTFTWNNQLYSEGIAKDGSEETGLIVYGAALPTGNTSLPDYYTEYSTNEEKKYNSALNLYEDGYVKTRYRDGSIVTESHNGMKKGNTLLLYSLDTSIALNIDTKIKDSPTVKENYVITNGEREVRYRITPDINISSAANKTELVRNGTQGVNITITLTIPEGLHYRKGSLYFGYDQLDSNGLKYSGYNEGELEWKEEYIENADGTQTVYIRTYVSDIEKKLPQIYYDCTIGNEQDPDKDIKISGTSLSVTAEIAAEYSERNIMAAETHSATRGIKVIVNTQEGISKSVNESLVELGDDMSFTLNYGNDMKNNTYNLETVDILPHNGDNRKTAFTGGYRVKEAVIRFTSDADYEKFIAESGTLYFGKNNRQWSTTIENSMEGLSDIMDAVKEEEHITAGSVQYSSEERKITFDFSDSSLISNAYDADGNMYDEDGKLLCDAPVMYAYLPQITGQQRMYIEIIITPKNGDGTDTLITSKRNDSGNTVKETQMGGNVYQNSFYYRKNSGGTGSTPTVLVSNNVGISVIKRVISGVVWMDQDRDGLYNTESAVENNNKNPDNAVKAVEYPVKNVMATLRYLDDAGVITGGTVKNILGIDVEPVYTDENGSYSFENLAPGKYTVVFTESSEEGKEYRHMSGTLPEGEHNIDFEKLSVTTTDNQYAARGNKCTDNYDAAGYDLQNGTISRSIVLPTKDKIPTVLYSSPNWNLGLYYTDLTINKQWENMIYGVPANTELKFTVTGNQVTENEGVRTESEDPIYKAILSMTNAGGTVSATYEAEIPAAAAIPKKVDASGAADGYTYNWKLADTDRIYLQAKNKFGDISYHVSETDITSESKDIRKFYNIYSEEKTDETTMKWTYLAYNSQILGSITIVKKTGGGDPIENAEFSLYQTYDEHDDTDESFYSAKQGVRDDGKIYKSSEDTDGKAAYAKQNTKSYYKVVLGEYTQEEQNHGAEQRNMKALFDAGMYNKDTDMLTVSIDEDTTVSYKIHKEKYTEVSETSGTTVEKIRYFYYTNDEYSFTYELIFGGVDAYNELKNPSVGVIDVNDKYEQNGMKYSVSHRKKDGVTEYYTKITVTPADYGRVAVVEFINLPFYDEEGNSVYYTVRETKVPDEFISLGDFNSLTGINLYDGTQDSQGNYVHDICFEVENTKQMQLPLTGGSGMSTMVILGTMFTVLAGAYLVWLMYMKKRERGDNMT